MSGRRESKKTATRHAIAEAALTVMTHSGIDGFTVAAVAEEAGVSVRTFHNYFSSVSEALQYQCSILFDAFASTMVSAPAEWDILSCFEHAAEQLIHTIFDKGWAAINPEAIALYLLSSGESECADQYHADIDKMHAAIAARESILCGVPYSPRSLHVCLLYELSVAAMNATVSSFGLGRGQSLADQGIPKDEFLSTLRQSFATIRNRFIDTPVG